jgi:hypothetical protein
LERFSVEPPLVWPGQALSPGMPEAQGDREAWFLDCHVPQKQAIGGESTAGIAASAGSEDFGTGCGRKTRV